MEPDVFADWQTCWKANLYFYEKAPREAQKCVLCLAVSESLDNSRRSSLWLKATCSKHPQAAVDELEKTPELTVCATCDQMYMLNVLRNGYECRLEGCRRKLRLSELVFEAKITKNPTLLREVSDLIRKYHCFECAIHCDDVRYTEDPSESLAPPTQQCDHDRNVCNTCLKATFENSIRGGKHQMVCPDPECKKPLDLEELRTLISREVFEIYTKKLASDALSKHSNFRWCACGHGQIHGRGESEPEWMCLSCSKINCYICKGDSSSACAHLLAIGARKQKHQLHTKASAQRVLADFAKAKEDAARRKKENLAGTLHEIARTTKGCPKNGCGNKIERIDGCAHFRCKRCGTEFCWSCKVIWTDGRALHVVGCRLGTRSQVQKSGLNKNEYADGWDVDDGYDSSLDSGSYLIGDHM